MSLPLILDQVLHPRPTRGWFFRNMEGPKAMSFLTGGNGNIILVPKVLANYILVHEKIYRTSVVLLWLKVPIIWRAKKVLVLNIDKLLGCSNCLDIRWMYAHVYQYILSTNQVLFNEVNGISIFLHNKKINFRRKSLHPSYSILWFLWKSFHRIIINWTEDLQLERMQKINNQRLNLNNFLKWSKNSLLEIGGWINSSIFQHNL